MMNTKICHICQDFASHDTASCPNSVCKICHQRGHVSKNCHQKTFVQPSKNVSFDEALLPFTPTKVGQVISDSKATKFQAFLTNYQRPEDDPSDPTFQPKNKVRKLRNGPRGRYQNNNRQSLRSQRKKKDRVE